MRKSSAIRADDAARSLACAIRSGEVNAMRFMLPLLLTVLGVVCRVSPHPWNFAPVGAIALFAGATFADRRAAMLVPLATMFAGDTLLELLTGNGYHSLMPVIY